MVLTPSCLRRSKLYDPTAISAITKILVIALKKNVMRKERQELDKKERLVMYTYFLASKQVGQALKSILSF